MASLGVTVQTRTAPPSRGAPTDTGTLFLPIKAASGPTDTAVLIRSVGDFAASFGVRAVGNQAAYDYLDTFFREGGARAYVSRYTGTGSTFDTALATFGKNLGPGQVAAVDETAGAATYGKLLDHAAQNNRFAVLDVANADTLTAMNTLGDAVPDTNASYGALFGPWVEVPGPAGVVGAGPRTVPASAAVAALMNRVDAQGNPNRAAAGRDFPLQYVTGFARDLTQADAETALTHGYNVLLEKFGVLEVYGFQTSVAQNDTDPFWQANCSRARMWIVAQATSIGEHYMFRPIDGRGLLAEQLRGDIVGVLKGLYQVNGLYGETEQEAFAVTVGAAVNTEATVAQGELHAVAEARLSLHAKSVVIELVSVPITGRVSTAA